MARVDNSHSEEREVARLLRAAGPREAPPETARQQWEQTFRGELDQVLARRRRRSRVALGVAAGIALAVTVIAVLMRPEPAPHLTVRVAGLSGANFQVEGRGDTPRVGQVLAPGTVLSAGAESYLALDVAGYDLRLRSGSRLRLNQRDISLLTGELYASGAPGPGGSPGLAIVTRYGTVRDIGTQFTVRVELNQTLATVRRGQLEIVAGEQSLHATAPPQGARQITLGRPGSGMETATVPAAGNQWRWIYQSGRAYALEGQSVDQFLRWSTGESGFTLAYADRAAERYARTTIPYGDITDLDPEQAVAPVLATTDLQAELTADGRLLISLNRP